MNLCFAYACDNLCKVCNRHHCNEICPNFIEYLCPKFINKPYCCNGCEKNKTCRNIKMIYSAKTADLEYHNSLSKTRSGPRITEEEIEYANTQIYPRIKNGQSLDVIIKTDPNITKCTASYYNYTNNCLFIFRNIDLPKKVCYKARKKENINNEDGQKDSTIIDKLKSKRHYDDFIVFINTHIDLFITEMDTVIGRQTDNKVLLTLLFRKSNFMIAILLKNKKAKTVNEALNKLKQELSPPIFVLLFNILLTDNGVEFTMIEEIERIEGNNNIHLFFCDPGKSNQKGKIEKNHVELRKIIPKGKSLDAYNQSDINLALSHVNSYPRRILNYKSPYEVLKEQIGQKNLEIICRACDYKFIPAKDIILSPKLLKNK